MDKTVNPEDVMISWKNYPFKILWCWKSDYWKMYQLNIYGCWVKKANHWNFWRNILENQEASIIMLCGNS
jgi:hypothetical protein